MDDVDMNILIRYLLSGVLSSIRSLHTFFSIALFDRIELGLQHNETIDIFTDDYFVLIDEDSSFGSKSDNHLKVQ